MVRYNHVPGYDGFYRVGDDGSVWSKRSKGRKGRDGEEPKSKTWVKLKPQKGPGGYLFVDLTYKGKLKRHAVHRLILESFVGPCPPNKLTRHFPNRNPADNRLVNLQWGTHVENKADEIPQRRAQRGENHYKAMLSNKEVWEIRALYDPMGKTIKEICKIHNLSYTVVYDIVHRNSWDHI